MFESHANLQKTKLSLHMMNSPLTPQSHLDLFLGRSTKVHLPEHLFGDNMRLQQVLVFLVKSAMARSKGMNIDIMVAYDVRRKKLSVQITDSGQGLN